MIELAKQLDSVFPSKPHGSDGGHPNRISISLADDGDWYAHQPILVAKIDVVTAIIDEVQHAGGKVELDIALMPEDSANWLTEMRFSNEFLAMLLERRINFVITLYGSGTASGGP